MGVFASLIRGIDGENILIHLALVSLTAVFIALVTSLIKKIFRNGLSPSFHYYIWLVFAARLIFPFAPESDISIYNAAAVIYQNIAAIPEKGKAEFNSQVGLPETNIGNKANTPDEIFNILDSSEITYYNDFNNGKAADSNGTAAEITAPADANVFAGERERKSAANILLVVYLTVASSSILIYALSYIGYTGKIKKSLVPVSDFEQQFLDGIRASLNIKKDVKLFRGKESMLINVFSPCVILADDCPEEDKRAIIAHELLHYKNKDNIVNIILSVLKCVYWFNPFIWYFVRKIKDDMEILCDIKTINKLQYRKGDYARADNSERGRCAKSNNNTKFGNESCGKYEPSIEASRIL